MKVVDNILSNKDKVTMEPFYHLRYDTDLDEGFCAMQLIACDFTGCVEQLFKP